MSDLPRIDQAGTTPVFPFFVGCERSGTTLLRLMMNAHPQLAIPGESYFVARMGWRRQRYESAEGFDRVAFLADLSQHDWFRRWGLPDGAVRSALDTTPVRDLPEAVRRVFATYAAFQGKLRYGDKTPDYVRQIALLAALFPESKFVHIIRDGRDVALSLVEVGLVNGRHAEAAMRWKSQISIGQLGAKDLTPGRYLEIRYEALIASPEPVVRRVCDHIGLDFDPAMLRHHERAPDIVAGMNDDRHAHSVLPPTSGLRDWRTQMSPHDVAVIELLMGGLLADLGYERSGIRPTVAARAEAGRVLAMDTARRVTARIGPRGRARPKREASTGRAASA